MYLESTDRTYKNIRQYGLDEHSFDKEYCGVAPCQLFHLFL